MTSPSTTNRPSRDCERSRHPVHDLPTACTVHRQIVTPAQWPPLIPQTLGNAACARRRHPIQQVRPSRVLKTLSAPAACKAYSTEPSATSRATPSPEVRSNYAHPASPNLRPTILPPSRKRSWSTTPRRTTASTAHAASLSAPSQSQTRRRPFSLPNASTPAPPATPKHACATASSHPPATASLTTTTATRQRITPQARDHNDLRAESGTSQRSIKPLESAA